MKVMLDSGAFSAFNRGAVIDIDEYADFVKANESLFEVCINLDVMGDGKASYRNWKYLVSKGINVMPVFHIGTDEYWLKKYLRKADYICLGAIAKLNTKQRLYGLSHIWSKYLVDGAGMPKVKVHGLGLTSTDIMKMYPWYSVDSKSWLDYATYGHIIHPPFKDGQWCYDQNFVVVRVSVRAYPTNKVSMVNDYKAHGKKVFDQYISEKGYVIGKSVMEGEEEIIIEPGLCNDHKQRNELNAMYFIDLVNTLPEWPWAMKNVLKGFF